MANFIFQCIPDSRSSYEISQVRKDQLMRDSGSSFNTRIETLHKYEDELRSGWVPVGSVEFIQRAFQLLGIEQPHFNSYPDELKDLYCRNIWRDTIIDIASPHFIKPIQTKLFNGFVYDPMAELDDYDDHDRAQVEILFGLDPYTEGWVSDVVTFDQEFRFYIKGGKIIGYGRYDENDTPIDLPIFYDVAITAKNAVELLRIDHPYVVDMGILSTGEIAVVELNDAWAIGLYGDSLSPKQYSEFLVERWKTIIKPVL